VKISRTRVYQSDLKTDGCVTTDGACGIITEVTSESKSKTDVSMRRVTSDPAILTLLFSFYYVIRVL
jgi:hypothetical protein